MARLGAARVAVAVVLAVAAGGLAGCGSSGGQPASSSSTSSTPAPAAASSTAAATSTAATSTAPSSTSTASAPPAASSAKLTAPGTTLHIGQTAIVSYDTVLDNGNDGPSYKLAVTIEAITPGSLADFKGISLTGVPKGSSPTYVKLRMTNVGTKPMKTGSNDPADAIGAIAGNSLDSDLILTGYFPPCPLADTPNPFVPGQSFVTCETFMEHGPATKIGYNGSESTIDSPIIWTK
jgi:hypothetical protein